MNAQKVGIALLSAFFASSLPAQAECVAKTTASAAHVVELYTSEGCSSCPPAERWLNELTAEDASVRALEFHVDYWDALGWTDQYADARFTARQQQLASTHKSSVVYTPEVIVDGNEWRDWHRGAKLHQKDPATSLPLGFDITQAQPLRARLALASDLSDDRYRWYLAVTESGLTRTIGAGENRGSTLRHDHVVRVFTGPMLIDGNSVPVSFPSGTNLAHAELVAVVVDALDLTAVQAISLPLADCAK